MSQNIVSVSGGTMGCDTTLTVRKTVGLDTVHNSNSKVHGYFPCGGHLNLWPALNHSCQQSELFHNDNDNDNETSTHWHKGSDSNDKNIYNTINVNNECSTESISCYVAAN